MGFRLHRNECFVQRWAYLLLPRPPLYPTVAPLSGRWATRRDHEKRPPPHATLRVSTHHENTDTEINYCTRVTPPGHIGATFSVGSLFSFTSGWRSPTNKGILETHKNVTTGTQKCTQPLRDTGSNAACSLESIMVAVPERRSRDSVPSGPMIHRSRFLLPDES